MRSRSIAVSLLTAGLLMLVHATCAQCKFIDHSREVLFITFERNTSVRVAGKNKQVSGLLLRLHNNSDCAIIIESGRAANFYKPLPPKVTWKDSLRQIEYVLPDDTLVPEVQYRYFIDGRPKLSVGGYMFYRFTLLGSQSLLFEVPEKLLLGSKAHIEVPFRFKWEEVEGAHGIFRGVEHIVSFYSVERTWFVPSSKYPAVWFAPINDPNKPDWEILPQEAKPGEVILSKRNELGQLSNFAPTPFVYHDKKYASLEGFWQMMLYPEGPDDPRAKAKGIEWKYTREQVAQMTAFDAKAAGTLAEENMKKIGIDWCSFEGKRFPYRSSTPGEHYRLIVEATRAKVDQNPEVKRVLLATGDLILKPDHHGEENPPPEWLYCDIWMQLRSELQNSSLPRPKM